MCMYFLLDDNLLSFFAHLNKLSKRLGLSLKESKFSFLTTLGLWTGDEISAILNSIFSTASSPSSVLMI